MYILIYLLTFHDINISNPLRLAGVLRLVAHGLSTGGGSYMYIKQNVYKKNYN